MLIARTVVPILIVPVKAGKLRVATRLKVLARGDEVYIYAVTVTLPSTNPKPKVTEK